MQRLWSVVIASTLIYSTHAFTPAELTQQAHRIEAAIAQLYNVPSNTISRATLELALDVLRAKLDDIRALIINLSFSELDVIESTLVVIESKVDLLDENCTPMAITQAGTAGSPIPITGAVTIDSPGHYCLAADLDVASGAAAITIASNDVFLDLNGKRISNTGTTASGISITSFSNVVITNGAIENFDIGIDCVTSSGCSFIGCRVLAESAADPVGIRIDNGNSITVENAEVIGCANGIYLFETTASVVSDCVIQNGASTDNAYGIVAQSGSSNLIKNCIIEGLASTSRSSSSAAAGIFLTGTESCSKVINCTVESVTTPTDATFVTPGFAFTYGINAQVFNGSIDALSDATIATAVRVSSIEWHPDSRYLAVATIVDGAGAELNVYTLTDINTFLILPDASIELATTINSIAWSPNGQFLAVGSNLAAGQIKIYAFSAESLVLVTTVNGGANVNSVAWSADGNYLAVGANAGGTVDEIQVWSFSGLTLTLVTQVSDADNILAVDWSTSGLFLATGSSTSAAEELVVYSFNGTALTPVVGGAAELGASVVSVAWSADGQFLAIGTQSTISPHVYPVVNGVLGTRIDPTTTDAIRQVSWAPDGHHLAAAGSVDGTMVFELSYNGTVFSLPLDDSVAVAAEPFSVSWTADGTILATGGGAVTGYVNAYSAQQSGATNCVLQESTVAFVTGGQGTGVGISASSNDNLAISNVAFNNDINYAGLANVYRGGYLAMPTLIQNIAIPPM